MGLQASCYLFAFFSEKGGTELVDEKAIRFFFACQKEERRLREKAGRRCRFCFRCGYIWCGILVFEADA